MEGRRLGSQRAPSSFPDSEQWAVGRPCGQGWGSLGRTTQKRRLPRAGPRPAATLKAPGGGGRQASRRAVGAGLPANSLKCVGERGKEESVSSQQPRHLVEEPREDRDQITNTQPSARARAEEGRPGQELRQTISARLWPAGQAAGHGLALGREPTLGAWCLTPWPGRGSKASWGLRRLFGWTL